MENKLFTKEAPECMNTSTKPPAGAIGGYCLCCSEPIFWGYDKKDEPILLSHFHQLDTLDEQIKENK